MTATPVDPKAPAGWRLTLPLANLKGDERAKSGSWAAAIPDRAAARKAIPYGASVPSAPLQPLTAADLERLGVPSGGVKQI
ncbi:hypothetical protein [Hansschlegelia plantiphila]|uniref:Uncharacterized protein n=1 Tax=Hansschlegelia plantiphila TaxID=374655 RepID=A0A9W6MTZ3_9HYPH|nr:hypothetical protein [Hansschlegelia plantiphila]GLK66879.1 hypothetical protein GCM10008179_05170 [Hansschlegelia plantiphila]